MNDRHRRVERLKKQQSVRMRRKEWQKILMWSSGVAAALDQAAEAARRFIESCKAGGNADDY